MTTRARLAETCGPEGQDWQWSDDTLLYEDAPPLTYGDARKLLAHHDALAALYAHAKLRPANDAETFGAWAAKWMDLNTAEQDAWTALTTDPEARNG